MDSAIQRLNNRGQEYSRSPVARQNDVSKLPRYYSAFMHRCKKTNRFFLKFLIILLLMSPHGHVNSQIKRELATVLLEENKLVSDPEFTTSSHSPEHFESKSPSHVQANHHLRLQFLFLLIPVRLKDSSVISSYQKKQLQFMNIKNKGTFHTQIRES